MRGKADAQSGPATGAEDHPRVCGEKPRRSCHHRRRSGSPPRVRRKVMRDTPVKRASRITPACAGKRQKSHLSANLWQDHPRVCGEKLTGIGTDTTRKGSPPRVRGKVTSRYHVSAFTGITPACAGKSRPSSRRSWDSRDHPRVCGEKGIYTGLMP